jgi:SAM-dependent methyltransferase
MVRCGRCGLLYRDPLPPPSDDGPGDPEAWARIEERVGSRRAPHFERFLAEAGPPGRLLDVGCGPGFFLRLAAGAGWDATGLDPDPAAVRYATERLGVQARVGVLAGGAVPPASVDLVTLWNVLECVADPVSLLRQVARVLRPGGRVFARTQNTVYHERAFHLGGALHRLVPARADRPYAAFIFNTMSFSPATLRRALETAGLRVERVANSRPVTGDPYLGLGPAGERLVSAAKLGVHGLSQAVALASGGRWLIGPSIQAWAERP